MLTPEEMQGRVSHGLRGSRRTTKGKRGVTYRMAGRRRAKASYQRRRAEKLAYQKEYDATHRKQANERVKRFAKKNPERRKAQMRAAYARYYAKKKAERAAQSV